MRAQLSLMFNEVTVSIDFFINFYDIIQGCHEGIVTKIPWNSTDACNFFMNRNIVFMIKFHGGKNVGQIIVNHGINFKMTLKKKSAI